MEPSSRLLQSSQPSGELRREVGAHGERGRETLGSSRAVGRSARTHKGERARESGYGSSGRESSVGQLQWARAAWNKAAKRRGTTANGVHTRKGVNVRAASAARSVERGKNPEDGTGEGLVILTFPAVIAPVACDRV